MTGGIYLSRFSLTHPRMIIAGGHAIFAAVCFLRPNLDILLRAYEPFGNLVAWGIGLAFLALILIFAARASLLLMVAQLLSAAALFTIALLLSLNVGLLPTACVMGWMGVVSLLLFRRSLEQWLETQGWFEQLSGHPPRWLKSRRWFQRLHAGREERG